MCMHQCAFPISGAFFGSCSRSADSVGVLSAKKSCLAKCKKVVSGDWLYNMFEFLAAQRIKSSKFPDNSLKDNPFGGNFAI